MYLLLAFAYLCTARHIQPLMYFSTYKKIWASASHSSLTSGFFKHAWHASPGTKRIIIWFSLWIWRNLFLNFQMHLQAKGYYSVHAGYGNGFNMFVVAVCDAFHCQVAVKLFFRRYWRFIESFQAIHRVMGIKHSPKYGTEFINVSIANLIYVFWISWINLHLTFFQHTWMLVSHLWLSCNQCWTYNLCIYLCADLLQDYQSDLTQSWPWILHNQWSLICR